MKPPLVLAVGIDAVLKRLEICQEIAMRKHDATRLARRAGGVENLGYRASRGCIAWVRTSFERGRRSGRDVSKIIDDHRRWRAGKLRLLAVAQNELDLRVSDDALNEIVRCCGIHRYYDGPAQEDSPKARNPPCGVGAPEEDAVPGRNSASCESVTPE